jgi:hypothetical protein
MPTQSEPSKIPVPLSSFPGINPQECAGRLVNCYSEPLDDPQFKSAPSMAAWRRQAGFSQFNSVTTAQNAPYRGGLIVNTLSYEVWSGNLSTVNSSGTVTSLGTVSGTKKVSMARNQAATPNVMIVDLDNGAYTTTGGAPTTYNAGGVLPQPNSVCFQDGYFFFTIGDGRCFATGINNTTINALTFITAASKSDVLLLRAIAYMGNLYLFTSGGAEIWTDTAQPTPAFPYSRLSIMPYGLVQSNAIAGWETGFDTLLWAAQDFGIYMLPWGATVPTKVSSPDVDRFIEARTKAGDLLTAGCYEFSGKKFWHITSDNALTTWEFNLSTQKWNERTSLMTSAGTQVRSRMTCGHPAFGQWLIGDTQSGNLLFVDPTNFTENGSPQLMSIESGPVEDFPNLLRIARADFEFVMGVGQQVGATTLTVLGAISGTGGVVRLRVNNTAQVATGDQVNVSGVVGTTEANGTFIISVFDAFNIELAGTVFVNAYTSGGTVVDVSVPDNVVNPRVAISMTKNGGLTFDNPSLRALGQQGKSQRVRASVKARGQSGPMGVRWKLQVSDPVYVSFLKGTMSSNPREVGQ